MSEMFTTIVFFINNRAKFKLRCFNRYGYCFGCLALLYNIGNNAEKVEKSIAVQKEIGYTEFQKQFSTEEDCRKRLIEIRFPNGFICPDCRCTEYYPLKKRNLWLLRL